MANHDVTGLLRGQFDAASRTHFSLFLRRVMATVSPGVRYVHNWHIEAIAEYLASCARGQVRRLIINVPPRMLKSTMISVAWPAWLLGHRPSERIMAASYAQALSLKHSTDCRAVVQAPWYSQLFTQTRLADDQNEKEKFATTMRGYRRAVSVGGAAIGEGGNILIVDDPLNPLQATHRHQREAVNQWFDHTWATRLDDKATGSMVVVMQRLHAEDLSGYLLGKGGWEHLCLSAIAPARLVVSIGDFEHVREMGEALHPKRESLEVLERLKRDVGSTNFSAQYQQMPVKLAGALVRPEWFSRFMCSGGAAGGASPPAGEATRLPHHIAAHDLVTSDNAGQRYGGVSRSGEGAVDSSRSIPRPPIQPSPARGQGFPPECFARAEFQADSIIQSWDTGIKAGAQHDASACATFAVVDGVHHLIDMLVVRMEYPQLKRLIVSHAARFTPEAVLMEDKGSGQSLLQDIRRETELPLIGISPSTDKVSRLLRVTPLMEAGKMALPNFASWLAAFEAEFFSFPDCAHDDQVDAVSQYLNWVVGRAGRGEMRVRRV